MFEENFLESLYDLINFLYWNNYVRRWVGDLKS